MFIKRAVSDSIIDKLIADRWSPRSYDETKTVSKEQIFSIVEAARWAPSCFGDEPWRMIIWDKNTNLGEWERAFDCLAAGNQTWVKNAQVLILACADTLFRKGNPNRWAQFDTGAACQNIYLQSVALGLIAHPMGGFDRELIAKKFEIPERYTPMAMIAVGYQASVHNLEGDLYKSEIDERKRHAAGDNFFDSLWGNSIK